MKKVHTSSQPLPLTFLRNLSQPSFHLVVGPSVVSVIENSVGVGIFLDYTLLAPAELITQTR